MLTKLDWLPQPPSDFKECLAMLRRDASDVTASDLSERLVALAATALDETQLSRMARLIGEVSASESGRTGALTRARIGLVGDGTLSLLAPAIVGSALRHGMLLDVTLGGYNNAVQEAMDASSQMHAAALDMAIVASDARLLGLDQAASSAEEAEAKVTSAFERLRMVVGGLRKSVTSAIFVQSVPLPTETLFGSLDRVEASSAFSMIEALNRRIAAWAAEGGIVLIDIARLAASVGLEHWHDPRHWHASKLCFAPQMIPVYGDVVARTIAAVRGKARKCLVLDLDNTLWGGVIGDDGLEGIQIGQGSSAGEAFLAVQQMALELRRRGIVLAVCSKNEDEAARKPFRDHPDMLLREDHIAVFQANWTDKAANLRMIAAILNIGLDALVFLDDNPAERLQVRRELPMVATPELPDDPAFYPRVLAAAGYFEAVAFSQEDRDRAAYYQANAQRDAALQASGDLDGYLASLDMDCAISPVDAVSRNRVAQLVNKSNQFNLTTRRYSEHEVADAEQDPKRHIIQVRLADRFGDNGIISVIVADKGEAAWEIDTWLMSCRVLGRKVEEAVLAHLMAAMKAHGACELVGRYVPSAKNAMVEHHYEKLGFTKVDTSPKGVTEWRLAADHYVEPSLPMRVNDTALASAKVLA